MSENKNSFSIILFGTIHVFGNKLVLMGSEVDECLPCIQVIQFEHYYG